MYDLTEHEAFQAVTCSSISSRGIVKTCGLACHDEVARSVAGRGRSCRSDQGPSLTFSGRQPTSHERLTGLPWDASYHDGPAPWDIGRPQPAIVRLASEGGFAGAVLDAGCGTGENALHVASLGLSVLGVDVAETALAIARAKADDLIEVREFRSAPRPHGVG
jgi:2-polyprenyl-3-methyl-5-hydroxy-6-metoxy-1,4-benzoquinol methylase